MISATCIDCGNVQLTAADILVRVCIEDNAGSYNFRCPICGTRNYKPAEPRIVDLLVASGAVLQTWRLPAELFEPHSGGAINHDDVLVFHEDFGDLKDSSDPWFRELLIDLGKPGELREHDEPA